jgi:hypothetical protein
MDFASWFDVDAGSCYAGIGSRSTPGDVLAVMEALGERLGALGWVLRTGGAGGADQAFMAGAEKAGGGLELYLPWSGFQGFDAETPEPSAEALELAARFHPAWGRCSSAARSLHARNGHQVLGAQLDSPAAFVACWTPDGSLDGGTRSAGGTGQALRIAVGFGVPVVNLARADHRSGVEALLGSEGGWG